MPGVFTGEQVPTADVSNEPTHWYTVAGVGAAVGVPLKWLMIVTAHMTTPPPPLPEPSHCCTRVTGPEDDVVFVVQAPAPAPTGPAAPVQTLTVIIEGAVATPAPVT